MAHLQIRKVAQASALCLMAVSVAADANMLVGGGAAPPPISLVNENMNSTTGNVTSLTVNIGTSVAGHLFTVNVRGFNSASTPMSATTVATSNGTACAHATASFVTQGSADLAPFSDWWYCQNNAAPGSVTFTATFTSSGALTNNANTPQITAVEWAGAATTSADAGIGNTTTVTGATSISVATNGAVPQTNDLVISGGQQNASAVTGVGGGQTQLAVDADVSYQLTSSGTVTHSYSYAPTSNNAALSIVAFKHP